MRLVAGACPSLTPNVVSKLESHGIRNMNDFMLKDCEELAKETSVSYRDLVSIRRVAIAHYSVFAVTGQDLLQQAIHTTKVFTTGSKNLDKLLDGGLTTGEVVEVCGGAGEGKTALCVQLALHAALNHGLTVLYVDPVNSVNHLRMGPIVEGLPHDAKVVEETLSRVKVMHVSDVWELFGALNIPLKSSLKRGSSHDGSDDQTKIKMVIVDALPLLMMPLITKEDSKQGLGILNQLAVKLKTVAKEQQVVVVVVNDVVRGDNDHYNHRHHTHHNNNKTTRWIPALGRFWRFVPQIRLYLRRRVLKETSGAPVRVDRYTKSESLVLKSPMDVNVAVWQGTRVKPSRALVTLPFESLIRVDTDS